MRATILILAAALLLAACGQRGPLYLPDKQKTEAPPARPQGGQEPAAPTGDVATPDTDKTPPETPPPGSEDTPDDKTERKPSSDKPTTPR